MRRKGFESKILDEIMELEKLAFDGAAEIARWLQPLMLEKDPGSVPSTLMVY